MIVEGIVFYQATQEEEIEIKPRILVAVKNKDVESWFQHELQEVATIKIYHSESDLDNQDGIIILRESVIGGIKDPTLLADNFVTFNPDGHILFVAGVLDRDGKEQIKAMKKLSSHVYVASVNSSGSLSENLVEQKLRELLEGMKNGSKYQEEPSNESEERIPDPPKKEILTLPEKNELYEREDETNREEAPHNESFVPAPIEKVEVRKKEVTTKEWEEKERDNKVQNTQGYQTAPRRANSRKYKEHECKIITITSPKGGVGKTTTAVNIAVLLQTEYGQRTALLELTKQTGTIISHFQLNPSVTIKDWVQLEQSLETEEEVEGYLLRCPITDLALLPGQSLVDEDKEKVRITVQDVEQIISTLSPHFDCIVIDGGTVVDEILYRLCELSHRVLLLSTIESGTLQDCHYMKPLLEEHGIEMENVFHILNKYKKGLGMTDKEAVALVGLEQHHLISYAAKVDRVNKGAREPYLARTRKKGDKYQRELMELVDKLIDLPDEQQKKSGLYGLLKKVMG